MSYSFSLFFPFTLFWQNCNEFISNVAFVSKIQWCKIIYFKISSCKRNSEVSTFPQVWQGYNSYCLFKLHRDPYEFPSKLYLYLRIILGYENKICKHYGAGKECVSWSRESILCFTKMFISNSSRPVCAIWRWILFQYMTLQIPSPTLSL